MTEHNTNANDGRELHDTTKYADFDPEKVAGLAADNMRDMDAITSSEERFLIEYYQESDAKSAAEVVAEIPERFEGRAAYIEGAAEAHVEMMCDQPLETESYHVEFNEADEVDEYEEPDCSFAMAVVKELASRGEWGAIHYTSEKATRLGGFGPVSVAEEEGVDPDPVLDEAVRQVSDAIALSYNDHAASCGNYGPDADTSDAENGADCVVPKPANSKDGHYRLNDGWVTDEADGRREHRIFAELDRLHQAGVDVVDYRVIQIANGDDHPDILEIKYAGVSADEIERHRYRHIKSKDHFGVASRHLSEIPRKGQEVETR